jgi:hypothetical protein
MSSTFLRQLRRIANAFDGDSADNFGRVVANGLGDIITVDGEKDFTPERLRYYKDGTRRFLQYGTDANYSETAPGRLLEPDADQTLRIRTAERSFYPVGNDLWPSLASRVTQTPQAGDAVGAGYGVIDIDNFDPAAVSYSGSDADGFFWFHTADTGLDSVLLVGVQGGTIFDSRTVSLAKAADILTITEQRLNYYDVGPSTYRETYTNVADYPTDPQRNDTIGAVANDDGKGPERGSHRMVAAVKQAAGNTGLGFEVGSLGIRTPGPSTPDYKDKIHTMSFDYTNPAETWEVVGAIRSDPTRPTVKLRLPDFNITTTPGTSVNRTRLLIQSVDPANTNADGAFPADHADAVPDEHSAVNSIVEEIEDNSLTGPVEDDAGTDVTGATTAGSMDNPGAYQIGYDSITPDKKDTRSSPPVGQRELFNGDIALILADSDTSGTIGVNVVTQQNS